MKVFQNLIIILSLSLIFTKTELVMNKKNSLSSSNINSLKNNIIVSKNENFQTPDFSFQENDIKNQSSNTTIPEKKDDNSGSFIEFFKNNKLFVILLGVAVLLLIGVIIALIIFVVKFSRKMNDLRTQVNKVSFIDQRPSTDSDKDELD